MKLDSDFVAKWIQVVYDHLVVYNTKREQIVDGAFAWVLAHRVGLTKEAYSDRTVVDAHIVTALKQIFPNATFKDRYSY